jgi:hypothetical protein
MLDALRSGSTHALLPITPPACSHAVVRGHIAVHARFDVVVVVVGARDGEETFHGWALLCFVTVPAKAVAVDLSVWQAAGAPQSPGSQISLPQGMDFLSAG